MSASFEARKNSQATMITAAFAAFMLLLMFLLKWSIPVIEHPPAEQLLVELNIPDEELVMPSRGGGGGGGNPVMSPGEAGTASAPPQPGTNEDARDVEDEPAEKETPPILRPDNPKPTATKINENKSTVKVEPKKDPEPPAPPKPKNVLGKTTTGSSTGGGVATTYDRAGGTGTGSGVGNGSGSGGGSGTGDGGGTGSGSGRGAGPQRISGSRYVSNPRPMDAGENLRGKVLARIRVSPDGVGTFLNTVQGTTITNNDAISIIKEWLRRNRFNTASEESTVVYQFNFHLGG